MDGRMFDGIGPLLVLGFIMLGLLICAVPPALLYGVAWVIAPRVAFDPYQIAFWVSGLWVVGAGGVFFIHDLRTTLIMQ